MKAIVIKNKKMPKKLLKIVLATAGIAVVTLLWSSFRESLFLKQVTLYGDKSFEGAQVYVNNSRAGTMVWDEKEKLSYAKEERLSNIPSEILNQTDRLFVQPINGHTEIKIITKENKIYKSTFVKYEELQDNYYFDVSKFTAE